MRPGAWRLSGTPGWRCRSLGCGRRRTGRTPVLQGWSIRIDEASERGAALDRRLWEGCGSCDCRKDHPKISQTTNQGNPPEHSKRGSRSVIVVGEIEPLPFPSPRLSPVPRLVGIFPHLLSHLTSPSRSRWPGGRPWSARGYPPSPRF